MRAYLFLIFFLSHFLTTKAQCIYLLEDIGTHINKVESQLKKATTDSARAIINFKLYELCHLSNDTAKAKQYYQQGLFFGKQQPFLEAIRLFHTAKVFFAQKNFAAAELNLLKSDSVISNFTHLKAYEYKTYIYLLQVSLMQIKENEKNAMTLLLNKALPNSIQSGASLLKGKTYMAIATIFMNAKQRQKAALYLNKAIEEIKNAPNDEFLKSEVLTETHIYAAENFTHLKQFDAALIQLNHAEQLLHPYPKSNLYLPFCYAAGIYNHETKQPAKSLFYFNKGIQAGIGETSITVYAVNRLMIGKAKILMDNKKYSAAIQVMLTALKRPSIFLHDMQFYFKWLYTSYANIGNFSQAFYWSEKYLKLTDSLYRNSIQAEVAEMETKYKNIEHEKTIALLNVDNEKAALASKNYKLIAFLLSIIAAFFLTLFLIAYLYYKSYKKLSIEKEINHQQQIADLQKKEQLKFADALLQGEEKERKRIAADLHDGIGGILAGAKLNLSAFLLQTKGNNPAKELATISLQLDNAINELRRVAKNMMPETLLNAGLAIALKDICESALYGKVKLDFQALNISEKIPKEIQVTIYRIIQELLANVIRHASADHILVQCSQDNGIIFITVEDNGKGFNSSNINSAGIGLKNIKNRVEYLKGQMEIKSTPGQGTVINIEFNIEGK